MLLYWLKKISLVLFLLGSLQGVSQCPQYDMKLRLDTLTQILSIDVNMSIPDEIISNKDTLWFHLVANAYSSTNNEFSEQLLRRFQTDFYFYKDSQLSALKDISITSNGNPKPYFYHETSNEFIGILADKSRQFTFSYQLRLPKLIDGVGYKNGNYWLRNFYPQLVVYDGSWQFNHHLFNMDDLVYASDLNVEMDTQDRYLYTNGQHDGTGGLTMVTSKKMKNLAILLFKRPWESERGQFVSNGRIIPFEIVFAKNSYSKVENIGEKLNGIVNAIQNLLGEYPYESLTLFLGSNNCYKSDGFAECIKGSGSKDQLYADLTRIMTEIWLTDKSNINTFRYPWMSKGLDTYYTDILHHQLKIPMEQKNEFKYPDNEILYTQNKLRQRKPLIQTNQVLGLNNHRINYFYRPASLYQYIQTLTSRSILNDVIIESAASATVLTPEVLAQELETKSQREYKEAILNYISQDGYTDYSIQGFQKQTNSITLEISNSGDLALPLPVTKIYTDGTEETIVSDGFTLLKNINVAYDQTKSLKQISLDIQGELPEIHRNDNHFFVSKNNTRRPFSIKGFSAPQNSQANILRLTGLLGYNDNDGTMAGFGVSNATYGEPKELTFFAAPMYGFGSKKLIGQSWINYDQYISNKTLHKISYRAGIKSFQMNRNQSLDYSLRYIRIDPSITLTFDHPSTSGVSSSLSLKGFLINEEVAEFESANVLKGINNVKSTIFRLDYQLKKEMALSATSLWLITEQQSYGQQNYIKLSAILNQRFMYASEKNLYFRIFSAGFLSNTQRQSNSFQNVFTKGSIALIHQGFNDYTYDEYFFSRQNQNRLYDNQVSMTNGGGFRTPIGSAYSLGMSNHFATSVNFSSDIPILPVKLPIRIYFDLGSYSTYSGSKFSNNIIYNGGLSLHISNVVNIHIPLMYSPALGNIYKSQHSGFLSRISFGINLHQLDPWKF